MDNREGQLPGSLADRQGWQADIAGTYRENAQLRHHYEEAVSRINQLTFEAEVARLEFAQVFNAFADPTLVVGDSGRILRINQAALDILGLNRKSAALGRKCRTLMQFDFCCSSDCPLKQIGRQRRCIERELEWRTPLGAEVPIRLSAAPLLGLCEETVGVVVQIRDITERRRSEMALQAANCKLNRLATVDDLTQLANRRRFDEFLLREWRRMRRMQHPLSLVMADVDYFKRYNDHYGHQSGDECLRTVAGAIGRCARRPGDLPARYGGEEFAVILPQTDLAGGRHVAEGIRSEVARLRYEHAASLAADIVTLSLGVACTIPSADNRLEDLVAAADEALYTAKSAGRNRVATADAQ